MKTMFMLILAVTFSTHAQWSTDPMVNTPICVAPEYQDLPQLVSDASGGAIVTWVDWRNYPTTPADIYAQRIGANGFVQWTTDGVSVCGAVSTQNRPMIVADGSGGAIIVWEDLRNGAVNDIYAQRINSSGAAQWAANGIPVCTATGGQDRPMIATDGAGGVIITWYDHRSNTVAPNIYAQRIDPNGATLWTTNGVSLCPSTINQGDPKIVADGAGGAIVVWSDNRTNTQNDIYAQRINRSGVIQWATSGLAICTLSRQQWAPSIAPDGSGGAIISWADQRSTTTDDIYAQRVDSNGTTLWLPDGAAVSVGAGDQRGPLILPDASGGAIITWYDTRNGSSNRDIYAQHVGSSGSIVWSLNGIPICTSANDQDWMNLISDGNGGAIISWEDERAGGNNRHVYAQRVNATGDVQWNSNGVAISNASGYKSFSQILPIGTADAIITWGDERISSDNRNICAQQINANGELGVVTDVENEQQSVADFVLQQNYPNPFNPSTTIKYTVPNVTLSGVEGSRVLLKIYDVLGNEVAALVDEEKPTGSYEVNFDAKGFSSGVYFYRLQSGSYSASKKLILIR